MLRAKTMAMGFYAAAAALLSVGLTGCDSTQDAGNETFPEPVDVAMQTWIGYGYAVIAEDKGYFGEMEVNLSIVEDGAVLVDTLSSGQTEIIGTTLDQFVLRRTNGLPAQLFLLTDDSYGGDGLVVDPSIGSFSDLKGRTIAYTPGPSSEYVLATALNANKLSFDDVKLRDFADPADGAAAFISGNVDAVMAFQPFLSQAQQREDGLLLFDTKSFPNISLGCFVVNETLKNKAAVVERFNSGVEKARVWAQENPEESDAILRDFFRVNQQTLDEMRGGARLKGASENSEIFAGPIGQMLGKIEEHYRERGAAGKNSIDESAIVEGVADTF